MYHATVYNVLIASPSDVATERNTIRQVLAEWNNVNSRARRKVLLPVSWETHSSPQMGEHPQDILNKQIAETSDLLVGVFWARVGTATRDYVSGTVEEIHNHVEAGRPAMLYFSKQPVVLDSVDQEQYESLKSFKEWCRSNGLYQEYEDISDFRHQFYHQLQLKLNSDEYFHGDDVEIAAGEVEPEPFTPTAEIKAPSSLSIPHLSEEATRLLAAAAESDGYIVRLVLLGGKVQITAGGQSFVEGKDRRTAARWEGAIRELQQDDFIEARGGKGEFYAVTDKGFRAYDMLKGVH